MRAAGVLGALALAAHAGCVETLDMRRAVEPPSVTCGAGERIDPARGACAPCVVDAPPDVDACPCAFQGRAAPFPYCEGEAVAYDCEPCAGSIASCRAYDAASGAVSSCASLAACCLELSQLPGARPCCPVGTDVICEPGANPGQYAMRCDDPTCCAGPACPNGDVDCATRWQRCEPSTGTCVPACEPLVMECSTSCVCQDIPNPP